MNIILFDYPDIQRSLLPLTFTRPVAKIRVGILTLEEKWERYFNQKVSCLTMKHLESKFPLVQEEDNLLVNGAVCPDNQLFMALKKLSKGECLVMDDIPLGFRASKKIYGEIRESKDFSIGKKIKYSQHTDVVDKLWKIFKLNAAQIKADFDLVTRGRKSEEIKNKQTIVYGGKNIFLEEGVVVKSAILNAENGPIYLGKNSQVHAGAIINGAFALCEGAQVSLGARIRGDSTIGPYSKAGGEISNSVMFSYSNKLHEGFIGNTVIGEWCNIGAGTNTSNLKNNYGNIKIWNYSEGKFKDTGEQFCGLFMGDHSKCGINTMFNTGTIVGVAANIFGSGFPRTWIPSFSWGGAAGFSTFKLPKVFEMADKMMTRRGKSLTDMDKEILAKVFEETAENRIWEKG